ncbi:MAG: response regulator, partial [Alphaproteobacteria bacterium]|nr:response regulator [Alphaproteobacteria bacterium]
NAVAALEMHESEATVDLMLVDIQLPGGVSGLDLAEQVKARRTGTRILFMSGNARLPGHATPALPKGANLLPKPFYRMDLAQRVRAALDS